MKLLSYYRNLPSQHINTLWDCVYKDGVKAEKIREILLFYIHHRTCLPPLQKVFDTLLITLTGKLPSKKMKLLLFQCVEEICAWLDPECIVNTVRLLSNKTTAVEFLSCFLINSNIPSLIESDYIRLLSFTNNQMISLEDGCKILTFVLSTCPQSLLRALTQQIIPWLHYTKDQPMGQGLSKTTSREIDDATAKGLFTALTLTNRITENHIWCTTVFSSLRSFLSRPEIKQHLLSDFLDVILDHCKALVNQCSEKTTNIIDRQLQSTVLQETVHILSNLAQLNTNLLIDCLVIIEVIETHAIKTKDTATCIRVWKFFVKFGNHSELTTLCLDDFICRNFTQGNFSYDMSTFILDHAEVLEPFLCKYFPNLLKIIATHPSSLVEEYVEIVQHLVHEEKLGSEVLHGLLDLPVLSATICLQQSQILRQAGFKDPVLGTMFESVLSKHKSIYSYFMRNSAQPSQFGNIFSEYPEYFSSLKDLTNYGLVKTCSQIVPLLFQSFFKEALKNKNLCEQFLPILLQRTALIFQVPGYQQSIIKHIAKTIEAIIIKHPNLVNEPCVLQFLSVTSNSINYSVVYTHLLSAIGKCSDRWNMISEYFDTIECCMYEVLADKQPHPLALLNLMTNTLAKLSSRNVHLIPRTLNALDKVSRQVQASDVDKVIVKQHNEELKSLLHNPYIANTVLANPSKQDMSLMNIILFLNNLPKQL